MRKIRSEGELEVVVRSHKKAAGISLGWTDPVRQDRNIDTITPAVPSTPSTMPGPIAGDHDCRSTVWSRTSRSSGASVLVLSEIAIVNTSRNVCFDETEFPDCRSRKRGSRGRQAVCDARHRVFAVHSPGVEVASPRAHIRFSPTTLRTASSMLKRTTSVVLAATIAVVTLLLAVPATAATSFPTLID